MQRSTAAEPLKSPWALPEGWRWERLADVAPINQRRSLGHLNDDDEVSFVPMNAVGAETGSIDVSTVRAFGAVRQGFTRFAENDVLFAKITPCMENGKIAVVPRVPHGSAFGSTEFHVFTPERVLPKYLYYWLSQRYFRELAEFNMTGTAGQKRVPLEFLRNSAIPVPNRELQKRIVSAIDGLLSDVDGGEAALARARGDLETWRKALLKAAVTGELTADWRAANPPSETGADLLARILADRRARWEAEPGKRYVEAPEPSFERPFDLPEDWAWATVHQLGEIVTGGTPSTSEPANYGGEVPFFTPGDLDAGARLSSTRRTISVKGLGTVRPIPARSVLVTCIGATIGKVGFNAKSGATNQQINTIIPELPELAEYIFHYFDGPGRHLVVENASSTTMPILNKGDFTRLVVPLPPLSEVAEIIRALDVCQGQADSGAEDISSAEDASASLRQSILAAAFRGDLVA